MIWHWPSASCANSKNDLERTDATKGNTSFAKVLDDYAATLTGAKTTLENKRAIVAKLKQTLFGCDTLPLRSLKPSQVTAWLSKHYGDKSASSHNQALTVCRDALDMAVADKIITESPAAGLKYRKPAKPIRLTPTEQQFRAIVESIRNQRFSADAGESGDFVEFLGLAGLGQAEASSLTRADVDLDCRSLHLPSPQDGHRIRGADLSPTPPVNGKALQRQEATRASVHGVRGT